MPALRIERVPAHMRDFQIGVGWPDAVDLACDPAQALRDRVLPPALGHELHADADAEKGPRPRPHAFVERLHHPADAVESMPAIRKGANPRQDDAIGASHPVGVARHRDLCDKPCFAPCAFERLGGRMQIARAVIHDGDDQRDPPGWGNRPMISDPGRTVPGGAPRLGGTTVTGDAGAWGASEIQVSKNLRSADSRSSPTTMPASLQCRRASVNLRSVAASNPTSSASRTPAANVTEADAPSTCSAACSRTTRTT